MIFKKDINHFFIFFKVILLLFSLCRNSYRVIIVHKEHHIITELTFNMHKI